MVAFISYVVDGSGGRHRISEDRRQEEAKDISSYGGHRVGAVPLAGEKKRSKRESGSRSFEVIESPTTWPLLRAMACDSLLPYRI